MTKKTVYECDKCGKTIENAKNRYELDRIRLKTVNKVWNGGHRSEYRTIDLDFCEKCAKDIGDALETIAERLKDDSNVC